MEPPSYHLTSIPQSTLRLLAPAGNDQARPPMPLALAANESALQTSANLRPVPPGTPLDIIPAGTSTTSNNISTTANTLSCFVESSGQEFVDWRKQNPGKALPRHMRIDGGIAECYDNGFPYDIAYLDESQLPYFVSLTAMQQGVTWNCYRFEGSLYWRSTPLALTIDIDAAIRAEETHPRLATGRSARGNHPAAGLQRTHRHDSIQQKCDFNRHEDAFLRDLAHVLVYPRRHLESNNAPGPRCQMIPVPTRTIPTNDPHMNDPKR